mmetsp:Transcript_17717/g.31744  ORF Transcript_17717/g.31744 Transcript_17717/m.31744 type:complete len:289 (-) Transcript_17717:381-1247(-)
MSGEVPASALEKELSSHLRHFIHTMSKMVAPPPPRRPRNPSGPNSLLSKQSKTSKPSGSKREKRDSSGSSSEHSSSGSQPSGSNQDDSTITTGFDVSNVNPAVKNFHLPCTGERAGRRGRRYKAAYETSSKGVRRKICSACGLMGHTKRSKSCEFFGKPQEGQTSSKRRRQTSSNRRRNNSRSIVADESKVLDLTYNLEDDQLPEGQGDQLPEDQGVIPDQNVRRSDGSDLPGQCQQQAAAGSSKQQQPHSQAATQPQQVSQRHPQAAPPPAQMYHAAMGIDEPSNGN